MPGEVLGAWKVSLHKSGQALGYFNSLRYVPLFIFAEKVSFHHNFHLDRIHLPGFESWI